MRLANLFLESYDYNSKSTKKLKQIYEMSKKINIIIAELENDREFLYSSNSSFLKSAANRLESLLDSYVNHGKVKND